MNTCHAIQINSESTTRYQLFRATDGRELIGTYHDTTPSALLDHLMSSEDVYPSEHNGLRCWKKCSSDRIVAYKGHTSADFGDYGIVIYTDYEAAEDELINSLINA
jgi:hypothetical protein